MTTQLNLKYFFRYHYDCIRVHCAGEKILVPIHGFPVINYEKDKLIPSLINFGTKSFNT